MNPAAVGLWITLVSKALDLWNRIRGKKPPDDTSGTAPVTTDKTIIKYRKRPLALVPKFAFIAGCLLFSGCATFKADSLETLAVLCNQYAPCEPEKKCPPVGYVLVKESSPLPPVDADPGDSSPPENDPGAGVEDLSKVTWLDPSPVAFPITATLDNVRIRLPKTIMWNWTPDPSWPADKNEVVGNIWVIVKINGRWYGSTFEYLRARTQAKTLEAGPPKGKPSDPLFIQSKRPPVNGYTPKRGDVLGFMATSYVRGVVKKPLGRSPVRWVVWP